MTATVHTHHARHHKLPLADWCGDRTDQFVMWVKHGDEDKAVWSVVAGWFAVHLYGLVITAVALSFVTGCVVTFALNQDDFWAILFALAGYPSIAGAIAYHWGDPS